MTWLGHRMVLKGSNDSLSCRNRSIVIRECFYHFDDFGLSVPVPSGTGIYSEASGGKYSANAPTS